MGIVIGMDEAGYGPNLGPLVISVTAWQSDKDPADTDFWSLFDPVITQTFGRNETRLHVGDSKKVYSPSRGVKQLERSVLSLLGLMGPLPQSFRELVKIVSPENYQEVLTEPWFADTDLALPVKNEQSSIEESVALWSQQCELVGVRPLSLHTELVCTERFNRLSDQHGSKGIVLSEATMQLLRKAWNPDGEEKCWIVGDKHGGRNRYDDLLQAIVGDLMIFRREEGTQRSEYKVNRSDIRFQTKAEEHFPVAFASMLSKYLRELSMELFNQFWQQHLPDLKPTKGYPMDAKRFRNDVKQTQSALNIPDVQFWRQR